MRIAQGPGLVPDCRLLHRRARAHLHRSAVGDAIAVAQQLADDRDEVIVVITVGRLAVFLVQVMAVFWLAGAHLRLREWIGGLGMSLDSDDEYHRSLGQAKALQHRHEDDQVNCMTSDNSSGITPSFCGYRPAVRRRDYARDGSQADPSR